MNYNDLRANCQLSSQTNYTLGSHKITDQHHTQDHTTSLYPKQNTSLEPNSVAYIPLKWKQKTKIRYNKDKHLLIIGNPNVDK